MSKTSKTEPELTIEDLKKQRRDTDRQIRALLRAQERAREEALVSAQQALGKQLSDAVGADSPEAVSALFAVCSDGQFVDRLRQQVASARGADDAGEQGTAYRVIAGRYRNEIVPVDDQLGDADEHQPERGWGAA